MELEIAVNFAVETAHGVHLIGSVNGDLVHFWRDFSEAENAEFLALSVNGDLHVFNGAERECARIIALFDYLVGKGKRSEYDQYLGEVWAWYKTYQIA